MLRTIKSGWELRSDRPYVEVAEARRKVRKDVLLIRHP
jgi:hypothetical protein